MEWILYFFKKNFVFFSENDCLRLESLFWRMKSRNHPFRKEEVRSQVIASTYKSLLETIFKNRDYGLKGSRRSLHKRSVKYNGTAFL